MRCASLVTVMALLAVSQPKRASAAPPTSITPNGFGTTVTSPSAGFYNIQGGTAAGGNLFHSFLNFNLGAGDTADFNVSSSTTNIIARVTGGPSSIDGTITSTVGPGGPISHANLFLLNPAGLMFTANAQVNLGGSFVVSTANYIKFSDGSIFYGDVSHPVADAGLTSSPVSAFGFLTAPASISMTGSQLTNPGGIHFIGGDLTLDQGATLLAPSGYLTLFSTAGAGVVGFDPSNPGAAYGLATNTAFGNITIQNGSYAGIDGAGGGKVVIRGGHLVVDGSTISSANSGPVAGGSISIQADQLSVESASLIDASTSADGNAGNVMVHAGTMTMDDSRIGSNTEPYDISATGNAGSVSIHVDNALTMTGTSNIQCDTYDSGAGGDVLVHAGSLTMDNSYLTSASEGDETSPLGNGGSVNVNVDGAMSLTDMADITTFNAGSGNGGNIMIHAGSLTQDGAQIFAYVEGTLGHAGSVVINVDDAFSISRGSQINTSTHGDGDAGDVEVHAGSLSMDDASISSGSLSRPVLTTFGNAGFVTVSVDGAFHMTGSEIDESTQTDGNAGNIMVHAGSLTMDSYSNIATSTSGAGNAGSTTVNVGSLRLGTGSEISSNTAGVGDAGSVTVQAGMLSISGTAPTEEGPRLASGITSSAGSSATGNGGDVTVTSGNLALSDGGTISTSSSNSNAGNILISAGTLALQSSGSIDTSAGGNGGSITLNVGSLVYLLDSQIVATAGGNGGNIRIDPQFVVLDTSLISANAARGQGGNITIITGDFLNQDSLITATGATNNGSISISAPNLDLSGGLLPLASVLVSDENKLRESCARSITHETSSLIEVGRGGTESAPDELQADFGMDTAIKDSSSVANVSQ